MSDEIKRPRGKPKGTTNDYHKSYIWVVEKESLISEFNTIEEISKFLKFTPSKVKRLIFNVNKKRDANIKIYKKYIDQSNNLTQ